jgi:3-deoxy-manno-octulosonate cytidylyltransferase (CMP-KDO synthetase)
MPGPLFRVVIPARFASSRLPGKPLLPIAGRPMIQHVWERAVASGAAEVLVATDDARIADAVTSFGGRAMMTSAEHVSGTDRLAEVAARAGWPDDAVVVNLQGDEPQLPGELLVRLANALHEQPTAAAATMAGPIVDATDVWNPNVVKVVVDALGFALYFSRAPIPWVRSSYHREQPLGQLPDGVPVYRHLGLYGYRVGTLLRLSRTAPPALEHAESLEQLRLLHLGLRMHVSLLDTIPAHGVDTPEDLARVEALLSASARN